MKRLLGVQMVWEGVRRDRGVWREGRDARWNAVRRERRGSVKIRIKVR